MRRVIRVTGWTRAMWPAALMAGLAVGAAAQTQPAQTDPWKQPPEGRTTGVPGQQTTQDCSGGATWGDHGKMTTNSTCPSPSAPANPAQQFPYPGDPNAAAPNAPAATGQATQQAPNAAQQFPYPGDSAAKNGATSGAPAASGAAGSQLPANKQFPYPGDGAAGLKDAGSSGDSTSSSSSSSSSSSGADGLGPPPGAPADTTPVRPRRRRAPDMPKQTPTQRESEDLKVAGFYQNDGNFRGAYLRAQDAVLLADDDADAHLALAAAARKLGRLDEAEKNYRRCLELDPVPKTRKQAEVALKEMTGGG